jgi:hypothetical protein
MNKQWTVDACVRRAEAEKIMRDHGAYDAASRRVAGERIRE